MGYIQKRKKYERVLYTWPTIGILLVVAVMLFFAVWSVGEKAIEVRQDKKIAETQLGTLTEQKDHLDQEIDTLNSDAGVEKEIRDKYPVVKDGEGVVVIVDDPASNPDLTHPVKQSFWNWLKGLFIHK